MTFEELSAVVEDIISHSRKERKDVRINFYTERRKFGAVQILERVKGNSFVCVYPDRKIVYLHSAAIISACECVELVRAGVDDEAAS
jgi:hypothetical protein